MAQKSDSQIRRSYLKLIIRWPTADTLEIVHYTLSGLRNNFVGGNQYKKTGIIITEITNAAQPGLFDSIDREKRKKRMESINLISGQHGHFSKAGSSGMEAKTRTALSVLYYQNQRDYKH